MAKKKEKPQVINNIQELNIEIDYDKLAEAIAKAKNIMRIKSIIQKPQRKKIFGKRFGV